MSFGKIVGTGPELIKFGIRGIEPVIEELLNASTKEIHVLAYMFTQSAKHILELIEKAAAWGSKITLIVNDFRSQDRLIQKNLRSMTKKFLHVDLYDF